MTGQAGWAHILSLFGKHDSGPRDHRLVPNIVQSLSRVQLFATPWIAARQASLSITNSRSSLKLMSIVSVMPSSHLIICHPLFLRPPIPPSIRVFSNESTLCMRWPKYRSFSFSIIPSKEHLGLISFRMDWLELSLKSSTDSELRHVVAMWRVATAHDCLVMSDSLQPHEL